MNTLAIHLALHGSVILTASLIGGLLLYRVILENENQAGWHLLHAGGTARGVLLIALAAIIHLPTLPSWQLSTLTWLMIFFSWASTLAMFISAISGERGLRFSGSNTNRFTFILYGLGVIGVFPACFLLIFGLLKAL